MTAVIDPRYHGPPGSANGGYACGVAAAPLHAPTTEVRLHRPPPLGVPLTIDRVSDGVRLVDAEGGVVASARALDDLPPAVPRPDDHELDAAVAAFDVGAYADRHWFPHCFTCGPAREPGDGLRLFPAPVGDGSLVAWRWTPAPSAVAADGLVDERVVWAALDCPGGLAWMDGDDAPAGPAVLGRLAARVVRRPAEGEQLVVAGWRRDRNGRRLGAGTAVWDTAGEVVAVGDALWIELDAEQAAAFGVRGGRP